MSGYGVVTTLFGMTTNVNEKTDCCRRCVQEDKVTVRREH
jgi:hypothetical protein